MEERERERDFLNEPGLCRIVKVSAEIQNNEKVS